MKHIEWIYSDKHAIEELNKLSQQNADMLAMLKEIINSGEIPYCETSPMITKAKELIKKVEGGE